MSNTAGSTSGGSMKGFSVLQPSLGAPLSWMPAVGTKELEQLINAYLPGPASAQEKRAAISLDFFEFTAQTGENFKYYPVPVNASPATRSPASSTVSASPALSNMSYGSPSQPSTPAPRTASRTSATKAEKTDYSHLPGMKILTTDGQDVTNSVSRGCKSKEQREHAHLMRVLKACDACKKKKIRCDPSHKRRSSSQVSPKAVTKPAKKAKKSPSPSASQTTTASFTSAPEASFELGMDMSLDINFDDFPSMDIDDILAFNPEPIDANLPQDFYGAVPQDFDFFLSNEFSPAMASSTDSFDSPAQPLTPVGSGLFSHGDFTTFSDTSSLAFLQAGTHEPSLPYMTPDATHGSNYVDFNLYSPASSFIDEEPQKLKAGAKNQTSAEKSEPVSPQTQLSETCCLSSDGLSKARSSTGLANNEQLRVNFSEANALSPQEPQRQVQQDDQVQQDVNAGDQLAGGVLHRGDQRSYHGDNGGHDSEPAIATVTRPHGLLQAQATMRMNSPVTAAALLSGMERNDSPTESLSPVSSSASAPVSPLVSPHIFHRDEIRGRGGARANPRTISPSELHAVVSSPSTLLVQSSILAHTSPSAAPSALEGLTPRRDLPLNGGLPANGGLVVAGGLQGLNPAGRRTTNIASGSSPSAVFALAQRDATAAVQQGVILRASAAHVHLEAGVRTNGTAIATTTSTASTSGLGLQVLNHGDQRQALHGVTVNHNDISATGSSPRHTLPTITTVEGDVAPFLPVRQWLGQQCIPSEMLSTQLAVFGLVSMLLIMGLTTSLLHHLQSAPILAYLPSSASSSTLSSWVFLSCLSTLSPTEKDIPDTGKSIRRPGLQAMAGLVRIPLASF